MIAMHVMYTLFKSPLYIAKLITLGGLTNVRSVTGGDLYTHKLILRFINFVMIAAYVRAQIMGEQMLIFFSVINTVSRSLNMRVDL